MRLDSRRILKEKCGNAVTSGERKKRNAVTSGERIGEGSYILGTAGKSCHNVKGIRIQESKRRYQFGGGRLGEREIKERGKKR